mmetsp:Transcript_30214/g.87799  ORF Transcript_30214/g.87799 Transcript_30214/m.87799 type:complete len:207 (-) Transcript_30214:224-844(-)
MADRPISGVEGFAPVVDAAATDGRREVHGVAHEEIQHDLDDGKRILSNQVSHLGELEGAVWRVDLLLELGCVGVAACHVVGELVVLGVCVLPAPVGHQQQGVDDEPHRVVDGRRLAVRPVAALVAHHPRPGRYRALDDGIGGPCDDLQHDTGAAQPWDNEGGDVGSDGEQHQVAQEMQRRAQCGPLLAVWGDGVVDLLHRRQLGHL